MKRSADLAFRVPPAFKITRPTKITCFFRWTNSGGNMQAALSAYDVAEKTWVPLTAQAEVALPDPARFFDPATATVRLKADITQKRKLDPVAALRANAWRMQEFDVAIVGE